MLPRKATNRPALSTAPSIATSFSIPIPTQMGMSWSCLTRTWTSCRNSPRMETVLRSLYRADGINLGMNIGKAAGAGVAGHVHMHILPRWIADANFVSVIGETRVLPEALEVTWERIRKAFVIGDL